MDNVLPIATLLRGLGSRVGAGAAVDPAQFNRLASKKIAEGRMLWRGAAQEQHAGDTRLAQRLGEQLGGPALAGATTDVAVGGLRQHRLLRGPPGGGELAAVGIAADPAQLADEEGACALDLCQCQVLLPGPCEAVSFQQRAARRLSLGGAQPQVVQ